MNEKHAHPIAGPTIVIVIIGALLWLASSGCSGRIVAPESADRAENSLYPTQDLAQLGAGGGLQFVNGYANW